MKIAKFKGPSEFEIQSKIMNALPSLLGDGFIVRGEYKYHNCIFDIAIFNAGKRNLICTIEVKKRVGNQNGKNATINQLNKYQRRTGKPCILVTDKNVDQVLMAVKNRFTA